MLCGIGSSGCCGRGVGSSGRCLPLVTNQLLLLEEVLLAASPPANRVNCFGLTEGAAPADAATGGVSTPALCEGCSWVPLMVGECGVLGLWKPWVSCVPWRVVDPKHHPQGQHP